jgi:hypothetical protein
VAARCGKDEATVSRVWAQRVVSRRGVMQGVSIGNMRTGQLRSAARGFAVCRRRFVSFRHAGAASCDTSDPRPVALPLCVLVETIDPFSDGRPTKESC